MNLDFDFLGYTFGRRPEMQHTAIIGTTRYGKSECCLRLNVPRLGKPNSPAFVVIDPHGSMAKKFGKHAVRKGLLAAFRLVVDILRETQNTPGYDFFSPSTNRDPDQREAENRERIAEAIAVMLRAEGKLGTSQTPMIEEGLTWALTLLIYQQTRVPFFWLKNCFIKDSPEYKYLVANCTDDETQRQFEYYAKLSPKDWEYKCGAAHRRLRRICQCPQFRKRCAPSFDLAAFLNSGGVLLVDGSSKGNLSRPDASMLMGMIINLIIALARSGQLTRHVVLIVDEGVNAALIDLNLSRALAEAAKWGLEIQLIVQNPLAFPHPEIEDNVFQNCDRQFFFKQVNSKAAAFTAETVGIPTLEPLKVRFTESRYRSVDDGVIEIPTESVSESTDPEGKSRGKSRTLGKSFRAKRAEIEEKVDHYWNLKDLITLVQQAVMNLGVGECFIKQGSYVSKEPVYIQMLEEPWSGLRVSRTESLADAKWESALEQLKQRPEYRERVINLPVSPPQKPAPARPRRGSAAQRSGGRGIANS